MAVNTVCASDCEVFNALISWDQYYQDWKPPQATHLAPERSEKKKRWSDKVQTRTSSSVPADQEIYRNEHRVSCIIYLNGKGIWLLSALISSADSGFSSVVF